MMNFILGGYLKGENINSILGEYVKVGNVLISTETVQKITLLDENSTNYALKGAIYGGTTGAIVGANTVDKKMLIEILWKDGQKSVAEVEPEIYQAIMVSACSTPPSDSVLKHATQLDIDKQIRQMEADTTAKCIMIVIIAVIICAIIIFGQ